MEILKILLSLLASFLLGFLISYFKEKGKNKALKSDISKITDEKEKITIEYKKQLEEIKKEYQLDIDKRKYKYEHKQEQFKKFFQLLDQLSYEASEKTYKNYIPIITEFNYNYLQGETTGDKEVSNKAIAKFSEDTQKIMAESNKYLIKLRAETNSLKMIANNAILKTLEKMETSYETFFEKSSNMMKLMGIPENFKDMNFLKSSMNEIDTMGKEIVRLKELMIEQIRDELDKI